MTTRTDELTVLTKDHIKFIKTATTVCFRYVNGRSTVEIENELGAHLDMTAGFHYHGYGSNGINRECTKAFAMVHTPAFTKEWLTVVKLLKPQDTLELEWLGDTNGYVKVASFAGDNEIEAFNGLHLDQMSLVIVRGKLRLSFQLCLSVCPSNSARMFQYNGNGGGSYHD